MRVENKKIYLQILVSQETKSTNDETKKKCLLTKYISKQAWKRFAAKKKVSFKRIAAETESRKKIY